MGRRLPATLEADREGAVVVVPVLLVLRGLLLLPLLLGLLLMLSLLVAAQATHQAARSRPDGCALTGVSRDRAANGTNGRVTCCTSQGATSQALLLWPGRRRLWRGHGAKTALLLCPVVALEFVPLLLFLALPLSWIDHKSGSSV